ncbi:ABC transporter permease [Salsipaludibacter albus]|uniref:ABC transporter permease n=1 Tax=Salsipaludibacter albus TaxID=2849650 RepID=UPI001EE4B43E|nr:ABC transporter permease [Salsipaludibacter albus]MBY5161036.1 ABC transporter permease [Salsipaludibacter albus]
MTTTTAPATSEPGSHIGLSEAFTDAMVITRRGIVRILRLPQLLVFATIQPVMFLLLFNFVFGGALGETLPPVANGEYINWLMPGLLVQIVTFGAGQTATGLTEDLSSGVIDRFRSLPMARSAVLAGRTLADLLRNAFVITLMLVVAVLIGFRWQASFAGFLGGVALALGFAFSLSWLMASLGLKIKNPEAVQSAIFIPVFPFVFASSVFVPTDTFPTWLQAFADHQPVTVVANAIRGLMLGVGALPAGQTVTGQVWLAVAWIVGLLAIFAPLAVRLYRRAVI